MAFVLPCQDIRRLVTDKIITAIDGTPPIDPKQIQPASIDFRLSGSGYRTRASFLPGRDKKIDLAAQEMSLDEFTLPASGMILERGAMYLIPLMESVALPRNLMLICNPKSSTGRLDIFARVICDGGEAFDQIPQGYHGKLWVELSPRSFPIRIYPGTCLVQGRLKYLQLENPPALAPYQIPIHLDAKGGKASVVIGYRAKRNTQVIDVTKIDFYKIADFWEAIHADTTESLILDPSEFYILASQETVEIPPDYAAELAPIRTEVGEFRVHYAGFFDPGFGWGKNGQNQARAVLEMRAHNVPFQIKHGQTIGSLMFEPLLATPDQLYGQELGSHYQSQSLKLSKHFKSP